MGEPVPSKDLKESIPVPDYIKSVEFGGKAQLPSIYYIRPVSVFGKILFVVLPRGEF